MARAARVARARCGKYCVKEDIDAIRAEDEDAVPPYYRAGVLAAWSGINTYYGLTDRSPIYRMAIALHPAYQFEYFRDKWWKREDWIKAAGRDLALHYDRFAADNTSLLTDDGPRIRRLGPCNRWARPWQQEKIRDRVGNMDEASAVQG
ncbi:hypothetical protein MY1884_000903 [Beauveria asiatica]